MEWLYDAGGIDQLVKIHALSGMVGDPGIAQPRKCRGEAGTRWVSARPLNEVSYEVWAGSIIAAAR